MPISTVAIALFVSAVAVVLSSPALAQMGLRWGRASALSQAKHTVSDTATGEFKLASARMMKSMNLRFTGNVDVDFYTHMIPHHEGALDMARIALRHARDPFTRQIAQAIMISQQQEAAQFRRWLVRRGAHPPRQPSLYYIIDSSTYPDPEELDEGQPGELVGHTWAPGSGAPLEPDFKNPGSGSSAAVSEFRSAHARMMRNMDAPFTGDPDVDFRTHMIPHHQGAIDMARVALSHAKDPWTRQTAQAIITAQEREIYKFRAWLAAHNFASHFAE